MDRSYKDLLKMRRFPHTWCPGCGIGAVLKNVAMGLQEQGWNYQNTVAVSGIGCSGRMSGYMNLDALHTPHGRALTAAETVKTVRQDLNVIVLSGDGDLASIGGNHLLHTSRRNPDITVFCNDNEIYGLTGGQAEGNGRGKAFALTLQDSWLWQMHASMPVEDMTHEHFWRQLRDPVDSVSCFLASRTAPISDDGVPG